MGKGDVETERKSKYKACQRVGRTRKAPTYHDPLLALQLKDGVLLGRASRRRRRLGRRRRLFLGLDNRRGAELGVLVRHLRLVHLRSSSSKEQKT